MAWGSAPERFFDRYCGWHIASFTPLLFWTSAYKFLEQHEDIELFKNELDPRIKEGLTPQNDYFQGSLTRFATKHTQRASANSFTYIHVPLVEIIHGTFSKLMMAAAY